MKLFFDWLDDRTSYRGLVNEALYERIPGGARWRYVWGSTLVFTFVLQMITGVFLWMAYAPSTTSAWESVFYIQNVMQYGNLVRGMHHFAAQAMIILMALHLMQVVIDGAYRAPREINFWLGMILMQIVLGLSLTGYLLPWDQKGYYATQVATKIVAAVPVFGPDLQVLIQGGTEYGHHTLTRFFAMHAGVLPFLLIMFLILHIAAFRKQGITTPDPNRGPESKFWPDQILKDAVACLAVLACVMFFAVRYGAELNAPADPSEPFLSARPEWYFLFLFRFLKFHAVEEYGLAFGAIYVPGILMGILFLMPLIAKLRGGHRFNVGFLAVMIAGAGTLTVLAIVEDQNDPDFVHDLKMAHRDAERVKELALSPTMIPVEGAVSLLRNDPYTQGPRIFAKACSSCHRYKGHNGLEQVVMDMVEGKEVAAVPTAADLGNFGSREWVQSVLTNYHEVFAPLANLKNAEGESVGTRFLEGDMASFVTDSRDALLDEKNKESLAAIVEFIAAQSGRDYEVPIDPELVKAGREIYATGTLAEGAISSDCGSCHSMTARGEEEPLSDYGYGPNLTGYASAEWLRSFISNPGAEEHYGDNNLMPAYAEKLSEKELDLLVRWMVGDYYKAGEETAEPETLAEAAPAEEVAIEEAEKAAEGEAKAE